MGKRKGNAVGRKTKLTPEVQEKVVAALLAGNYQERAAAYAGVNVATYFRWLAEGESDDGRELYREFHDAVQSARASAEVQSVGLIRQAANAGTWQAAAWWLERSNPRAWGRRDGLELTGKDGGPIKQQVVGDDQRAEVTALIAELAARRAKQDEAL